MESSFLVKASFYKFYCTDENYHYCRNVVDIFRTGYEHEKIDFYLVMMNPGKCCLKHEEDRKNIIKINGIKSIPANLKEANSDYTQQVVFSLMEKLKANKIRMINLIDIVEPDSKKLKSILKSNEFSNLSIFSKEREKELLDVTKEKAPFIIAWGVNDLKEFKQKAVDFFKRHKLECYGWESKKSREKYSLYHLKPRNKSYHSSENVLNEIVARIENKDCLFNS